MKPRYYIAKHKNFSIRIESRSGGVFTALSDYIINCGGIVYGCGLDENFMAVHRRATSREERDAFRGSKYIQSNMGEVLELVRYDLLAGNEVLFSGTSCQIAGLKAYCSDINTDRLYCIDIVCHGVPSPMVWRDYMSYLGNKYHGAITNVNFRNKKKFGWENHVETITVGDFSYNSKIFSKLFYSHNIIRNSCYKCPYKNIVHPGDITIADAWGVVTADEDFADDNGVSLVLINTEKGLLLFEKIESACDIRSIDIEKYMQPPLEAPFPMPEKRETFWAYYHKVPFKCVIRNYEINEFIMKIKNKIKNKIK